ncbi:DHH phosphoesterase [Clavulina sp. PMI_390]|nr:DHH phosphoesterase [Clavulina sp. PMI_390]
MSVATYKRHLLVFMVACTLFLAAWSSRRLSLRTFTSKFRYPPTSIATSTMSGQKLTLSKWLQANKASFLADVELDGAKSWTIIMGNEAGDLDSCVSAIAYSYLTKKHPAIGLIQTPRPDLSLRAENIQAFELGNVGLDDLLCIDDIHAAPSALSSSFALVDHNSLLPLWNRPDVKVTGVIDHHEDEGKHLDADPRNVTVPIGSCASLVADTFKESFLSGDQDTMPPVDLANLLLSAIYIDTGGLKPKGKGETLDRSVASFLEQFAGHSSLQDPPEGPSFRGATAGDLSKKKHNVSHLSSRDLLRRDYKEYTFTTKDGVPLQVGLSTVPLGTKPWLAKEADSTLGYRLALEAWAKERKLDVASVLTSFKSEKGHKRREVLILVGGAIHTTLADTSAAVKGSVDALTEALVKGLEAVAALELEPRKLEDEWAAINGPEGHAAETANQVRFWKQGNTDATRKVIAPAFKETIEGLSGVRSTFAVDLEV